MANKEVYYAHSIQEIRLSDWHSINPSVASIIIAFEGRKRLPSCCRGGVVTCFSVIVVTSSHRIVSCRIYSRV